MTGSILSCLILMIRLALAFHVSNETKTVATNGRLWELYDTTAIYMDDLIQLELKQYARKCCVLRGFTTCDTKQIGYWAWIPDDEFLKDPLKYLKTNFDPDSQTDAIAKKMCGDKNSPINDNEAYPYFAVPLYQPSTHVEAQLLPKMKKIAESLYTPPRRPTSFYLFSAHSPCVRKQTSCLALIFAFTAESIYRGYNLNQVEWEGDMHALNVGFSKWFIFETCPKEKMRDWFCSRTPPNGEPDVFGMDYHKTSTAFERYDFFLGLSFVKLFTEDGDVDFEITMDVDNRC